MLTKKRITENKEVKRRKKEGRGKTGENEGKKRA